MTNTITVVGELLVFILSISETLGVTNEIKVAAANVANSLATKYGIGSKVDMDPKFLSSMRSKYEARTFGMNFETYVRQNGGWKAEDNRVRVTLCSRWSCRFGDDNLLCMEYIVILMENADGNGYHVSYVDGETVNSRHYGGCQTEGFKEVRTEMKAMVKKFVGDELLTLPKGGSSTSVAATPVASSKGELPSTKNRR